MENSQRARKVDVSDTSSDEEEHDGLLESALPTEKATVPSFMEPLERGEKVVFTDDDDDPQPSAKKPRPAPPPRRITVASGKHVSRICSDLQEAQANVHLFPLCWQLPRPGGDVTIHSIYDEDDVDYNIGAVNMNNTKSDPEEGNDLGYSELVGFASVAGQIVQVLSDDVDAVAVISDPWGVDYAPFVAYLAQKLYSVKHRGSRSITGAVRRPKNAKLKEALKTIGKSGSQIQMRGALQEIYKKSF